jgi:hypothetical protein
MHTVFWGKSWDYNVATFSFLFQLYNFPSELYGLTSVFFGPPPPRPVRKIRNARLRNGQIDYRPSSNRFLSLQPPPAFSNADVDDHSLSLSLSLSLSFNT